MHDGVFIGFDRDRENLARASTYLSLKTENIKKIYKGESFDCLKNSLQGEGIMHIDAILYDLGVSSVHLDE
jgi:16S rRNA C1402 N4-methylase RsmH